MTYNVFGGTLNLTQLQLLNMLQNFAVDAQWCIWHAAERVRKWNQVSLGNDGTSVEYPVSVWIWDYSHILHLCAGRDRQCKEQHHWGLFLLFCLADAVKINAEQRQSEWQPNAMWQCDSIHRRICRNGGFAGRHLMMNVSTGPRPGPGPVWSTGSVLEDFHGPDSVHV